MKYRFLLAALFTALLAAGCGKNDSAATASAPAAAPKAAAPAGPHVFEITAGDTMKFASGGQETSPAAGLTLDAKAGEDIKIILTNAGTQPKEVMGHNLVLLKPGSDVMAFSAAAMNAK